MKSLRIPICLLAVIGAIFTGGCGRKPDHNANWYYFWEKDNVIPGLDRMGSPASRWAWGTTRAYGAAHGPSDGYCLTDLCITRPRSRPFAVTHRTMAITFNIGGTTIYGCEQAAATMGHEKQHIANYRKRISPGERDNDGDGLADSEENKTPYWFLTAPGGIACDTYNLGGRGGDWGVYRRYGDDEFVARQAEAGAVATVKLNEDWSKEGAQWRH